MVIGFMDKRRSHQEFVIAYKSIVYKVVTAAAQSPITKKRKELTFLQRLLYFQRDNLNYEVLFHNNYHNIEGV